MLSNLAFHEIDSITGGGHLIRASFNPKAEIGCQTINLRP